MSRTQPHVGDHVYNPSRAECGQMPHGYVKRLSLAKWGTEWSDRECTVYYFKPLRIFSQHDAEFGLKGGDYDTLSYEEFEQYKVSSELPDGYFADYRIRSGEQSVVNGAAQLHRGGSASDDLCSSVPVHNSGPRVTRQMGYRVAPEIVERQPTVSALRARSFRKSRL